MSCGTSRECAQTRARAALLDLEDDDRVHDEEHGEEDGGAVEVALDHRAAADRAATAADAEGTGKARVFARVQEHQEDEDDRDDHLKDAENRVHGAECRES